MNYSKATIVGAILVAGYGLWRARGVLERFVRYAEDEAIAHDLLELEHSEFGNTELEGELEVYPESLNPKGAHGEERRVVPRTKRARRAYLSEVVAVAKVKMGTPERTAANILVARRICANTMSDHGVRPAQQARWLPVCVEAVFVASRFEIDAQRWGQRAKARHDGWCMGLLAQFRRQPVA